MIKFVCSSCPSALTVIFDQKFKMKFNGWITILFSRKVGVSVSQLANRSGNNWRNKRR